MRYLKYIIIFLFIPVFIFASGGSLYTRVGLGEFYNTYSARRMGFGELGVAVSDVENLSSYNPASWYRLGITRIETGMTFNGASIDNGSQSAFYSQTTFSGFTIGFPVDHDNGVSLVIGLVPVTNVKYEVRNVQNDPAVGDYTEIYKGDGGISKIFLGTSYKLPFDFIIGASLDYYTGNVSYSSKFNFNQAVSSTNAEFLRENSYRGFGGTFGLISNDLSGIIGSSSIKDLRFGLNFNYISDLTTDSTLSTVSSIGTTVYNKGSFNTKVPYRIGTGFSFNLEESFLIMADYLYQPWSNFEENSQKSYNLKDLQRISAGFEYRNAKKLFGGTFWEQIILRGGLSFEQTQYEINNTGIEQYSLHAGFGIPIGIGNFLDFAFQYGVRGETGANLFKENFYKAAVSINFGELWFQRFDR
ncbi:MAG: outer membrane protein transport protein [Bacteroidetes bacterium]|nr:outer membrane protein transport protein [Bacteroidota bacterium]